MPTAAFTTLGCKVNQYETQQILESFERSGFVVVPFGGPADVYVVNSCSVTSVAEGKSRYTVRKARRTNPEAVVVVTGCAAQTSLRKQEEFEGADVLVPNPDKLRSVEYLLQSRPDLAQSLVPREKTTAPAALGRTRATLKIQDGCNVYCSYCSIPFTRPVMRSRPTEEVVAEARKLAEQGFLEIVLTGVLIGSYGPETGSGGARLPDLIGLIAEALPQVRIRISSIEMQDVDDELIHLCRQGAIVPHFHLPLQSGSDGVLNDMNRPYRKADYLALCERLKREVPDLALTTDVLVGFPTETDERFEESLQTCAEAGFQKIHVFSFSPRYGTPADQWGDPIHPQTKQDRRGRLLAVAQVGAEHHAKQFLGRSMRVLVEASSPAHGLLEGLTDNYLTVRFAGPRSWSRSFVQVRIDQTKDGVLFGEAVSSIEPVLRLVHSG